MAKVNTVLGPIDTGDLGFTLSHEHVLCGAGGIPPNFPDFFGEGFKDRIVNDLIEVKKGGVDTIVDATTVDIGRDIELIAEVSRRSGVNIIASTGWFRNYHPFLAGASADKWAQMFIREIEVGVGDTGIKCGIIKQASDREAFPGLPREGEILLRAAARACIQTNVPIGFHTNMLFQIAFQQITILKEEGVDLRRVKIDHANDTIDLEFLIWCCEQGCYLGWDRYPGRCVTPPMRTRTMKALIDAGYGDRILPSHDKILAWTEGTWLDEHINAAWDHLTKPYYIDGNTEVRNPYGMLYIKKVAFPQLREMGVSEEQINQLCVDNPRRFFEGP